MPRKKQKSDKIGGESCIDKKSLSDHQNLWYNNKEQRWRSEGGFASTKDFGKHNIRGTASDAHEPRRLA